jgi:hypothetical protein
MARKPTGIGRGGARPGAGRPKGSKSKVYKPHLEKLMALSGGPLPRDVLLAVMRWHFQAKRYAEAVEVAEKVAPFVHPRLTASSVAVKPPSLAQQIVEMSDEELRAHVAELEELAGLSSEATAEAKERVLRKVKPRGNA